MENGTVIDRTPLRSKKFILASIWSICWAALLLYGFYKSIDASVLSAIVYVSGVVQALYLGGQSAVDALVRAAAVKHKASSE